MDMFSIKPDEGRITKAIKPMGSEAAPEPEQDKMLSEIMEEHAQLLAEFRQGLEIPVIEITMAATDRRPSQMDKVVMCNADRRPAQFLQVVSNLDTSDEKDAETITAGPFQPTEELVAQMLLDERPVEEIQARLEKMNRMV